MSAAPETPSPMMAQYLAIKGEHAGSLLFYRMGDFYELFFEDAEAASAALGIALTTRGAHQGRPIPMCGVPAHGAEPYLERLIRQASASPSANRSRTRPRRRSADRRPSCGARSCGWSRRAR